jgi:hypothetical protein
MNADASFLAIPGAISLLARTGKTARNNSEA